MAQPRRAENSSLFSDWYATVISMAKMRRQTNHFGTMTQLGMNATLRNDLYCKTLSAKVGGRTKWLMVKCQTTT
jgi:hypothetical protein